MIKMAIDREAMIDHMHQNGDVARKGAAESRERAKDLKENPQTINEYHYGERKMSLIDDEISLVQNIPQTIALELQLYFKKPDFFMNNIIQYLI